MRRDYSSVVVLVLYALLTVVVAWPLVSNMDTVVAGQSSDVQINLWADWWTKKAMIEGLDLFHTDYLFYPQGVSLAFHSFSHMNTLITLLLTSLMGHSVAYNATILLAFALSGFSMYLLVEHLTGCRPAAFVAGLVFAFHPYHRFESAHPVIVTTQWMPLFALALEKTFHGDNGRRERNMLLTALWFVLTALSSWHLMLMLAAWGGLYLGYALLVGDRELAPGALRSLLLSAVVIAVVLSPFIWPMLREMLGPGISYASTDPDNGIGNDVLAFLVPNESNPLLYRPIASWVDINDQTSFTGKRSAYLGYAALALAVVGFAVCDRARFWALGALVSLLLSLGGRVTLNGVPLHDWHLPWALPILRVMRHPYRLSVLVFFFLSVTAGYGWRWLHRRLAYRHEILSRVGTPLLALLILLEYAVVPFPTMKLAYPPFLHQVAEEDRGFGVIDFPMGRQEGKYYMYCQTIHGKRIAGGHVSRKPDSADAFIDGNPLLEQLDDNAAPGPDVDVEEEFDRLARHGFRYLIVHKRFLRPEEAEQWKSWFPFPPWHESDWLIVYPIPARPANDAVTTTERISLQGTAGPTVPVAPTRPGRKPL